MASCDCVLFVEDNTIDVSNGAPFGPSAILLGRLATLFVNGNFNGATASFEISDVSTPGSSDWYPLYDIFNQLVSFTAPGYKNIQVKATFIRYKQANSGGATSLTARMK